MARLDDALVETFGELIDRLRRERGLTMEALAKTAGCSLATIANVTRGRHTTLRRDTATLIFNALRNDLPISAEDQAAYARGAGLDERILVPPVGARPPPAPSEDIIPTPIALMVRDLIVKHGVDQVQHAIKTIGILLAGSQPQPLPPAAASQRVPQGPRAIVMPPKEQEGYSVQEFRPIVNPPPVARGTTGQAPKRKARGG